MVIKQQQGFCIGDRMPERIYKLMYKREYYNINMSIIQVFYNNQKETQNSKSLLKSNIQPCGSVQLNFISNFFTAIY